MPQLAADALAVQDACNLSGVAHGFARAMSDLRVVTPGLGTDAWNNHHIAVLWADKIASLTGTQAQAHLGDDRIALAYRWAHEATS